MAVDYATYRFSVEQYEQMGVTGVLEEDERVELIYGEIVQMSPMYGPHITCLNRVNRSANRQTGEDVYVQIQSAIRIPGLRSEPQPDLAIVRVGAYSRKPPKIADILLVGEVSDSSLTFDRRVKLPLYARAGIPETWIFNIVDERIERYTHPLNGEYSMAAVAERGQRLASSVLPDVVFDTDELILPESSLVED